MELQDLVGEHELTGVDQGKGPRDNYDYEDPNTLTFVLDGNTYRVTESVDDDYRSSMRDIERIEGGASNAFSPVRVLARYRTAGSYSGVDDVLELIDIVTGKTVLEVGTENCDDYYPYFIAHFSPENMACNQKD